MCVKMPQQHENHGVNLKREKWQLKELLRGFGEGGTGRKQILASALSQSTHREVPSAPARSQQQWELFPNQGKMKNFPSTE